MCRGGLVDERGKSGVVGPGHLGKLATAKRNDYSPQFPLRLMRKDFDLILSKSADLRVAMPATLAAAESNAVEAARSGEDDFSAVTRLMERLAEEDRLIPPAA